MQQTSLRIGFIGAGRLAASLAAGLHTAGYRVSAIASASASSAECLATSIGAAVASPEDLPAASDLVFLTVPDSAIESTAASIEWRQGQAAVHCSGALSLEVLAPARIGGAEVGCLHPLQSFPSRTGDPARFQGITCGIEADGDVGVLLERIARDLGADTIRLEGVDRAMYHAAAVFASNYVASVMSAAARVWAQSGLPAGAARPALVPLLLGSAHNIAARELRDALTGPIARGDLATVERHLGTLAEDDDLYELYRRLGAELLTLDLGHAAEVAAGLCALLVAGREPHSREGQ